MMPLVSDDEIESLREFALSGMRSTIEIYHKTSAGNDFSDDEDVFPDTPDLTVIGWFRNAPNINLTDEFAAVQQVDDGRLFLPVGTALSRGDKVVVAGTAWSVIDTNEESTYQVLLRALLRRES